MWKLFSPAQFGTGKTRKPAHRKQPSSFAPKQSQRKRSSLSLLLEALEDRTAPAIVGYYDTGFGQGHGNQVGPITAIGHTPVNVVNLSAEELAGLDVLMVQNPSRTTFGAEFNAQLPVVWDAVANGLTLIFHDRRVLNANTVLPGGADFAMTFFQGTNIDVRDNTTLVTNGPAGIITNGTLDGALFSTHGYTAASSLPADAQQILSTGNTDQIVTFSYNYMAGQVVYSSIPLDFHLNSPSPFRTIYAPNVLAYAVDALNTVPVAQNVTFNVNEDETLTGFLPATDADGDPLTYTLITGTTNGIVQLLDADTGEFSYTPNPNFHGLDLFTFRVNDGRADSLQATVRINVLTVNDDPLAVPSGDTQGSEGGVFFFDASGSSDPDGDALTYSWDFGDGENAIGVTVSHTFADNGVYLVTLTVDDGQGGVTQGTLTVQVDNTPPEVDGTAPNEALTGQPIHIEGSFTDPGINDTWTGSIDFGDGTATQTLDLNSDNTFAFEYTYTSAGSYALTVTISDGDGTASKVFLIEVLPSNRAPVAVLAGDTTGTEGDALQFDASGSSDPDGDALIYTWDFGDGQSATGVTVSHIFADNGTYLVTLTVDDQNGESSQATLTVQVENAAPVVSLSDPGAAVRGQAIPFVGGFTDPGVNDTWTGTVDFGDGSGAQPLVLNSDQSFAFDHTYTAANTYSVTVTITDNDGGTGIVVLEITVGAVGVRPNADNPDLQDLLVGGTTGNDIIEIVWRSQSEDFFVRINGETLGYFQLSGKVVVWGLAGNDIIWVSATFPGPVELYGDEGNDILEGGKGNDLLSGGPGNDWLKGRNGDDILLGGDGDDVLVGNNGNDSLDGGNGADWLLGGNGNDALLGGPGNDLLLGEAGDDLLMGEDGNDILLDWEGQNVLIGGPGLDLVFGTTGSNALSVESTTTSSNALSVESTKASQKDRVAVDAVFAGLKGKAMLPGQLTAILGGPGGNPSTKRLTSAAFFGDNGNSWTIFEDDLFDLIPGGRAKALGVLLSS
jgi:PKD repeat protein